MTGKFTGDKYLAKTREVQGIGHLFYQALIVVHAMRWMGPLAMIIRPSALMPKKAAAYLVDGCVHIFCDPGIFSSQKTV